jgi:hypothetical protein
LPQGNTLQNVAFVNGQFIAMGELGTILGSGDGTNWVRRESGVTESLRDCAYGGGRYVMVGDFGTVLTSADASVWTQQFAGTFYSLKGITHGDGQFVAVGEQTTIFTSPDGMNWTLRSSGNWDLHDVVHADGTYVAVGGTTGSSSSSEPTTGVILTSPDARVWTHRVLAGNATFVSVAAGAGTFAVAGGRSSYYGVPVLWTSSDAEVWEPGDFQSLGFTSISFGDGKWVAAEGDIRYPHYGCGTILVSPDLQNWSAAVVNAGETRGIAFGNGHFIASRADGSLLASTDGLTWDNPGAEPLSLSFNDLKYLNGSFAGVGYGKLGFSKDGSTWTNIVSPTNTGYLFSIAYGHGRYVAGGECRTVWTSTDGVTWTNPAPELSVIPYVSDVAVAYGNGVFVGAAGYNGDILTSPDGLQWTVQQLNTNENTYVYFRDIAFGEGRFVAVSERAVATSCDGTNWCYSPINQSLWRVTSGKGKFVAVGNSVIATSDDGTNWTYQISNKFGLLSDVAFGAGFFVVVEGVADTQLPVETPIWVSVDGLRWSKRSSKTPRNLIAVAYGNGTFVIGGGAGEVLQSDPFVYLTLTKHPQSQMLLWGPANRTYRIEFLNGFDPLNNWVEMATVASSNCPTAATDPASTNGSKRFYRAVLLP